MSDFPILVQISHQSNGLHSSAEGMYAISLQDGSVITMSRALKVKPQYYMTDWQQQ